MIVKSILKVMKAARMGSILETLPPTEVTELPQFMALMVCANNSILLSRDR